MKKDSDIFVLRFFREKPTIDLDIIQDRDISLISNLMYQTDDYTKAIELVHSKKYNLESLMTIHFSFEVYAKVYKNIDIIKDKIMKVFVDLNKKF